MLTADVLCSTYLRMGKKFKKRESVEQLQERMARAALTKHSREHKDPQPAESFGDFPEPARSAILSMMPHALRDPWDWRCRIKSRDNHKRYLDLVDFTFAHQPRYQVPSFLLLSWGPHLTAQKAPFITRRIRTEGGMVRLPERTDWRLWYIAAAQGKSVYKVIASGYLSKMETHHFLTAPIGLKDADEAFWYGIARAHGTQRAALNVAQSKMSRFTLNQDFWKDAARFFARNPPKSRAEIDDIVDYLQTARDENENYSLKGRSLDALRRKVEEWHRSLAKMRTIGGGCWAGHPIPDVTYERGNKDHRARWSFSQIKTGNDLYKEGQKMRHCVAAYKARCMRGDIAIWSLSCEFPLGIHNKCLTLEVTKGGQIVQSRGLANRMPRPNEEAMVRHWAKENGLSWPRR